MNVFVLCTGRCGSMTFARACGHLTNYTSAHESAGIRNGLDFPRDHIEVNNRLIWVAGQLERRYADAFYVHLTRDAEAVARSFAARGTDGPKILGAWRRTICQGSQRELIADARQYCAAVNSLIGHFLDSVDPARLRSMRFALERAETDWPVFCRLIFAKGDIKAGASEFNTRHNRYAT